VWCRKVVGRYGNQGSWEMGEFGIQLDRVGRWEGGGDRWSG
jgi:hypothetical protein